MNLPDMTDSCFGGDHDLCDGQKCECWCHQKVANEMFEEPAGPYPSRPATDEEQDDAGNDASDSPTGPMDQADPVA